MMAPRPLQLLALAFVGLLRPAPVGRGPADLLVANARLIDGTGRVLERAHITIVDGRIAHISQAASPPVGRDTIDARGRTVTPGLIDAHQHLFTHLALDSDSALAAYMATDLPRYLREYLDYGVTTIKSTGDYGEATLRLRDDLARGSLIGPRLVVVGPVFTAPGGHPASTVCGGNTWCRERLTVEADDPGRAAAAVRAWAARGVDAIKLVYDGFAGDLDLPKLDQAVMEAIVAAAHQEGLRVTAHTTTLEDARTVVRAGVDGLEHGVADRPVDQEFVTLLQTRHVYLVPTLSAFTMATRLPDTWKRHVYANFTALLNAGVPIAAGSDFAPPGPATLVELNLMVQQGATPMQALMAGTRDAAEHLGIIDEVGTIEVGKVADLVMLEGNPLVGIDALQSPEMVIHRGRVVVDRR